VLSMRTIVLPAQFRVWRAGFNHRQSGAGGLEFGVAAVAEGAVGAVLASAEYTVLDSIGNLPGFGGLSGIGYPLHLFVTATIRYTLSVWRKQLSDCRGRKTGFLNQYHQFNAKLVHFIGRLGTVPASADFCEFSGKQGPQSGDQNETRNDPDYVRARRDYFEPSCAQYIECLAQSIDQQPEIG